MNILAYNKDTIQTNENEGMKKSKEIICPKCYESCLIEIKDYKIKLYGCKNDHYCSYISLTDFDKCQYVNESKIICDNCNKTNKFEAYNKQFFKCLTCRQNLCPLCNTTHNKSHQTIDYDKKNYICNIHNDLFISYCEKCKNNLCMLCKKSHINNNHKIIDYSNMIQNKKDIKENINEFKNKIDKFKKEIEEIIKKLNIVSKNINVFYKIHHDIINSFELQNKNYEILKNINMICNNIKNNDINGIINEGKINIKIQKIINIYNKMIIPTLIYDGVDVLLQPELIRDNGVELNPVLQGLRLVGLGIQNLLK